MIAICSSEHAKGRAELSRFAEAFKEVEANIKAYKEDVGLFAVNCACATNGRS